MNEKIPTSEPIQPYIIQSWTQTIIRPTLIILMVTALMGAIFSLANLIYPTQAWTPAFLICFCFILESYATNHWLNQPERRHLHHLNYRVAEIIVMVLIIRFLTWGIQGSWPDIRAWSDYLKNPFQLFNDGFFWATLAFSLIAWQRTIAISRAFMRMKPDEAERAYYTSPRNERDPGNQPLSDDRSYLLHGFAQQFLGGGIAVLFCTALASIDITQMAAAENIYSSGLVRLGLSASMLTSLLIYFLCGFLLLSQGRLAVLEIRWLADGVKLKTPIGRHWHRQTLFLLLAIGLIAAFLPIGSTLPFVRILNLILYGIMTVITSIIFIISIIIAWLLSFFLPREANLEPTTAPTMPLAPPPQLPLAETNDTLQFLFSSAFWAVAIIISLVAFSFFLQDRGVKLNSTSLQRVWLTIKLWWAQLRLGVRDQIQDIQGGLQSLFQRDDTTEEEKPPPWRFMRVNALSPREKVYYFYLSTVKRANQRGVARKESETPLEFVDDLKTNWPDAEEEIEELTDAFLQARYSPKPIEEDIIPPIKKQWKRLKADLRKRKKRDKE